MSDQEFSANPLVDYPGLPSFGLIRAEHAVPALQGILADNRRLLENTLHGLPAPPTWEALTGPLEKMDDRLERAWSPIRHLHSVCDSPQMRDAYNQCLPLLTEYSTDFGQNRELYEAYEKLAATTLDKTQSKIVSDMLRDFRLSGVGLGGEDRAAFKQIEGELAALKAKFEQNVLDATQAWTKRFTDTERLGGIPEAALARARHRANQHEFDGYEFTLESPDYLAVMTNADNRDLRREMYEAYQTRASDRGPHAGRFDNSETMERILALRLEKARLLGYQNYAYLSLASKMAAHPKDVVGFLMELAEKARPFAQRELEELRLFGARELDIESLQAHDLAYVSEKLKQQRYAYSREDLKPYLPVEQVLGGLFRLVERLYGVRVEKQRGVETWHPDVWFFSIIDSRGKLRGHFYLDLYAREHKRGGAWMDECFGRWRGPTGLRTPVAYLTCNAARPAPESPALLAHDEMVTLFHEFGHGLHHLLTQVDYAQASGIRGVEWDAVELPSQFMENWCWQEEVLGMVARHYQTGEALPIELSGKLRASKNFLSGLSTLRQIEFALFDFRLHLDYKAKRPGQIQEILDAVRSDVAAVIPPEYVRFQHGFTHIFSGGYGAGYYSYKWAEVLSADVFALFEEEGLLEGKAGRRFLRSILEKGGTRPAMELFKSFRKRKPKVDALLRHSGLAA